MIRLKFDDKEICEYKKGIEYLTKVRGFSVGEEGIKVNIKKGESLEILKEGEEVFITISKKNELFRALSMLVGLLEENTGKIFMKEKGVFEMNAVMLDCSRNAVLKPEKVIEFFVRMAMMGYNTVMLYTEDVFEVEEYEYFGYMRGKYSINDLKMFDEAAKDLGLEMIMCIQTLGHLKTALRWKYAEPIKDTEAILLADEEKTYAFIEAMFKNLRKCCSSDKIHIGMDEAVALGTGKYFRENGYVEKSEVFVRHLKRVCEIAKKYDFKPMLWSDMLFKLGTQTEDYNIEAKIPESVIKKIPQEISMVYWDYYKKNEKDYIDRIEIHKLFGRDIVFAGGVWKWCGMGPWYGQTFETTIPALSVCRKQGIKNVIATLWGDDGGDISYYTCLLGLEMFAEFNYYEKFDMERLNRNFKLCTGYNADDFLCLALDDFTKGMSYVGPEEYAVLSRAVFYQDILCGIFDRNLECFDLEKEYDKILSKLENVSNEDLKLMFEYYRYLVKILKRKSYIGGRLRKAYEENNKEVMDNLLKELRLLYSDFEEFYGISYEFWHENNKPFGFDRWDMRIGATMRRIKTAERTVLEYLSGNVDKIDEFEEKLLWYGGEETKEKIAGEHAYNIIASVSAG